MPAPHVLIAGAGIGGLTAAIALGQNGAKVEIFEQAAELGEIGAGLQQSPNAMAVHAKLGTARTIEAASFQPHAGVFRNFKTGAPEMTTHMRGTYEARYGHKYLHIHRADLHAILVERAKATGVKIHLGTSVPGYSQTMGNVTLKTSAGEVSGDVLIGADGTHSKTREAMLGLKSPLFTGQVAWRGLVPADRIPKGTIPTDANNWLGPGKHFVAYYLRGGELINFVAVEEREDWTEEGWNIPGDMDDVRNAFKGWDPRITTLLAACENCYLWGLFDRPALKSWTDGRVALLGDAAHPMLPFVAQGSAMAIEDGWVLAHHILKASDMSAALKAYETARYKRASTIQSLSRKTAQLYHMQSPLSLTKRRAEFAIASKIPAAAFTRLDKIYGVDVTKDYPL